MSNRHPIFKKQCPFLGVFLLLISATFVISCSSAQIGQPTSEAKAVSTDPAGVTPEGSEPADLPGVESTDGSESVVVLWNEATLAAIRSGMPRPTVTSRALFIVHSAMYDAWTAYDPVAMPTTADSVLRRPENEHTEINKSIAVSHAAYFTLVNLYPEYERKTRAFSNLMKNLGYDTYISNDRTKPGGVGRAASQAVLASRQNDGSNAAGGYAEITSAVYTKLYSSVNSADPSEGKSPSESGFDPNHWQPLRIPTGTVVDAYGFPVVDDDDPASFVDQRFLTPHWGAVAPFALASGSQFRPPSPPQAGSDAPYVDGMGRDMSNDEAYHFQMNQVLQFSADLTDKQKVLAEFWADGPRSETPPGHWNAIAHGISERDRNSIDDDVKMYFALNGALFDAGIAAWDAKRAYDYVRPQSSIHHYYAGKLVSAWGGPNMGTQLIPGETWRPYQDLTYVTPPFPEYVSGHSTFSASAAEVLTEFTGSNRFYDGVTMINADFNNDGIPDMLGQHIATVGSNRFEWCPSAVVVLQWETFQDAADEAGISRLCGGIHFQDADLQGRKLGRRVGEVAYREAESFWNGTAREP